MMEKADAILKEKAEENKKILEDLSDVKKSSKVYSSHLSQYSKPCYIIAIGIFFALIAGLIAPMFGFFFVKNMFSTMTAQFEINMSKIGLFPVDDVRTVIESIIEWVIWMIISAVIIFVAKAISAICFAFVGEKITQGVRMNLYDSILRKNLGWHDHPQNAAGVLTTTLSSECQLLNGVSSEGTSVMVESTAALIWGVALAFWFSWPIGLVGLAITPFLMVAAAFAAKADK